MSDSHLDIRERLAADLKVAIQHAREVDTDEAWAEATRVQDALRALYYELRKTVHSSAPRGVQYDTPY